MTKFTQEEIDDAFDKMAESYGTNATYPSGISADEFRKIPFFRFLAMVIRRGAQGRVVGWHGTGKTSAAAWFMRNFTPAGRKLRPLEVNAANDSFDQHVLSLPVPGPDGQQVLQPVLNSMYRKQGDALNVLLLDDESRASRYDLNAWMQLKTSRTLLGVPVDIHAVVSLDNPGGSHLEVEELDFTQADRAFGLILGQDDTPWRLGLANMFPDDDLNGVFRIVETLTSDARQVLSARTLEYMIRALKFGLPGVLALPVSGPQGQMREHRIMAADGSDITERVVSDIARELGAPNPKPEHVYDLFGQVIRFGVEERVNVLIFGDPGVGKTSATEARLNKLGFSSEAEDGEIPTLWNVSAAGLTKEYFSVPFRGSDGKSIEHVINNVLSNPKPFVMVLDEANRADPDVQQAIMPILSERRSGNRDINVVTVIGLANPPKTAANSHLDTGEMDLAQASRYGISLRVSGTDIDWRAYLRSVYGEDFASPFIEWWEEDLDEIGRSLVSPRALERMMQAHEDGENPQQALPIFEGEYVRVSLDLLKGRLSKRSIPRLRGIAAEVVGYREKLASGEGAGKDFEPADPDLHERVYEAFSLADSLEQLEEHRNELLVMMPLLRFNYRLRLVEASKLQTFWTQVLIEGDKVKKVLKGYDLAEVTHTDIFKAILEVKRSLLAKKDLKEEDFSRWLSSLKQETRQALIDEGSLTVDELEKRGIDAE